MPSREKKPALNVDLDVGARASLEAKISTEIPAQSSGRMLDAITDMFRPFSERRGLKADQIRLQREEVLLEIAHRARRRLALENVQAQPLPNKFLVPFLEKASLEEADGQLVDRWADLLATCSLDPGSAHPRFVQILSEMTGDDARILRDISHNSIDEVQYPDQAFSDCPMDFDPEIMGRDLQSWLKSHEVNIDDIYKHVTDLFGCPGVNLLDVIVDSEEEAYSFDTKERFIYSENGQRSLDVLYSLNVLKECRFNVAKKNLELHIIYVCLTSLGVQFMRMCDNELRQKLSRNRVDLPADA